MRGSRVPWWGDLTVVAGLALAGLALALIPVPGPVRTAALLPLLLIVPGYALAAVIFRPGEISGELRMVLSVALSIGVTVLGGLLVQLVVRLDRPVWAALLAGVTLLAVAIALRRRDAMPADSEETRLALPRIGIAAVIGVLAATAIAGWAIAIATEGVHRQLNRSHFSSLSLVPGDSSAIASPVRIGVSNHEGKAIAYRVTVKRGAQTIERWRFRLAANQDWQAQLTASAISGTGPLIGRLDGGRRPYHRVVLHLGSTG